MINILVVDDTVALKTTVKKECEGEVQTVPKWMGVCFEFKYRRGYVRGKWWLLEWVLDRSWYSTRYQRWFQNGNEVL
jgi:hypothetical protein